MAFGKEIKTSNSVTTEMRTRKEEICHLSENGMEIKDNPDLCDFFFFSQHWAILMSTTRTGVKKSECMEMEYILAVQHITVFRLG